MQEQKRTFKYGDVFHVAGLDWIVLRTTPAPTPDCSDLHFCEATEDVFQAPLMRTTATTGTRRACGSSSTASSWISSSLNAPA